MSAANAACSRRALLVAASAAAAAGCVPGWDPAQPPETFEAGRRLLALHPAIDLHAHPGRSFSAAVPAPPELAGGFEARRVRDMQLGGVAASLFASVSDFAVLGPRTDGSIGQRRTFDSGEAYRDHQRQWARFAQLQAQGVLTLARSAAEIRRAHRAGQAVVLLSAEGAAFVGEDFERLASAQADGLRSLTLVHYRRSEYGDTQTGPVEHGGLSALGRALVPQLNQLGVLIDVAHASQATVRDVVERSVAPVVLSHSHLAAPGEAHPRLLTPAHAQLVASAGGLIGAWPSGFVNRNLDDYVTQILRLVDLVGVAHVGIGTDLDANFRPVLTDYAQFPELATRLLERGLAPREAAQILGGNFLRVLSTAQRAAHPDHRSEEG